jgi:hypothetical protein
MKGLLAVLAIFSINICSCGGAERDVHGSPNASVSNRAFNSSRSAGVNTVGGYIKADDDIVGDGRPKGGGDDEGDGDDGATRSYGHRASTAEARAVDRLIRRFYLTAAAGDGKAACALIDSELAQSRNLEDRVPVAFRPSPGSSALRGKDCAQIETLLFGLEREQLAAENATIVVTDVRIKDDNGLALLGFKTLGERTIPLTREGRAWRIDGLLDAGIP